MQSSKGEGNSREGQQQVMASRPRHPSPETLVLLSLRWPWEPRWSCRPPTSGAT